MIPSSRRIVPSREASTPVAASTGPFVVSGCQVAMPRAVALGTTALIEVIHVERVAVGIDDDLPQLGVVATPTASWPGFSFGTPAGARRRSSWYPVVVLPAGRGAAAGGVAAAGGRGRARRPVLESSRRRGVGFSLITVVAPLVVPLSLPQPASASQQAENHRCRKCPDQLRCLQESWDRLAAEAAEDGVRVGGRSASAALHVPSTATVLPSGTSARSRSASSFALSSSSAPTSTYFQP